jgi:hypothetical protein
LYNSGIFSDIIEGPPWPWPYGSWIYNYLCNQRLSPLWLWVRISIKSRCTTLCDKVCQWLATGRWYSSDPPVSSTNKTDRHDLTEIVLKVTSNTIKQTNKQTTSDIIEKIVWDCFVNCIEQRRWPIKYD